jgi:translation initiation factor 1
MPQSGCVCKKRGVIQPAGDGIVRVRIESKGRGGKKVSVIDGLDLSGDALKKLAGELKRLCGTGGTVKGGQIEIQGDHRELIVDALRKQGFTAKRAGG